MNKRERLEKTIMGEATDRVPVALWRHWPGDDQRAADLAHSIISFQQHYDWDFIRVMPASNFSVVDYGIQDDWQGAISGKRQIIKPIVKRSLDWTELRTLNPTRGQLGKYLECLRLVCDAFKDTDVPIIPTVYSPLAQAARLSGEKLFLQNMRTHLDRVRTGLNVIAESTLRLVESLRQLPIAGIFYVIEHATYSILSEAEYGSIGIPYDQKILESVPEKWWFNVTQFQGTAPMLQLSEYLPIQVLNWQDQEAHPSIIRGKEIFQGAVCGGLAQWQDLHQGTPATVRDTARNAIRQTEARRFILSVGESLCVTSPLSNIKATRDIVESIIA